MTELINILEDYLSRPVIFADQDAPRPPYPFITIKEIVPFIPAPKVVTTEENEQKASIQATKSLSITAFSKEFNEASDLILKTFNWFDFVGYRKLKEMGYVVERIESIMNRDSLIVDDYERRRGFDVILRFVHEIKRDLEDIEVVDLTINRGELE